MKKEIDKIKLKSQILEVLNIPGFKSAWIDGGVSNSMYNIIMREYGYDKYGGIFINWVFSDNVKYNVIPPSDMDQKILSNDQRCWRIKLNKQIDLDFIQNVYDEWRVKITSVDLPIIEQKLSTGVFLKNVDINYFEKLIETYIYESHMLELKGYL